MVGPVESQAIVIDSQAVFDWLVFRDPGCAGWDAALASGRWKWIFTSAMKAEFDAVRRKGFGARWPVDEAAVDAAWAARAHPVPEPPPLPATGRLVCSDRDDQKFIDLALAAHAAVLVSRDKALLKLARKALARQGLQVLTPAAWTALLGA